MVDQPASRVSRRTVIRGLAGAAGAGSAVMAKRSSVFGAPALHLRNRQVSGELRLWHPTFPILEAGYAGAIARYQEINPNVTFSIETAPFAEYGTKLRAALSANEGPDLITWDGVTIGELASAGYLHPLTQNVVSLDQMRTEFFPEYYLQSMPFGDIFAMGLSDPPGDAGLVANVDLMQAAGMEVPRAFATRAELDVAAAALTQRDGDEILTSGLAFNEGNDPVFWLSYAAEQGARFWDNATQTFNFNTPECQTVLQYFVDIYQTHRYDSFDLPGDFDGIAQGVKALAFMWPEYPTFARAVFPDANLAFIGKPPFVDGGTPINNHTDTWDIMINSGSGNIAAAEDFVRFLTTPEGMLAFADGDPGLVPLKRVVFEDPFYQEGGKGAFLQPVIESLRAGQMRFFGPFGNGAALVYDIWWPLMTEALQGTTPVADALVRMTDGSNADVAAYRQRYPNAPATTIYWSAEELPDGLTWT